MSSNLESGPVRLDQGRVYIDDKPCDMPQQQVQLLTAFLENAQEDLIDMRLWELAYPGKRPNKTALTGLVYQLRITLGKARGKGLIHMHRLGQGKGCSYRWMEKVTNPLSRSLVERRLQSTRWVELIPGQPNRPISLSCFDLAPESRVLRYSGTNYTRTGEEHYEWQSKTVAIDLESAVLLYIYSVTQIRKDARTWGFGFLGLDLSGSQIGLHHGYFLDAERVTPRKQRIEVRSAETVARDLQSRDDLTTLEGRRLFARRILYNGYAERWLKQYRQDAPHGR